PLLTVKACCSTCRRWPPPTGDRAGLAARLRLPRNLGPARHRGDYQLGAADRLCAILDATDTSGDPGDALARLVASSWQLVHQFRNILLAAQRELPAERIRGVH